MGKKSGSPDGDTKNVEARPQTAEAVAQTSPDTRNAQAQDGQSESTGDGKRTVDEWRARHFPADARGPHRELHRHAAAEARHRWTHAAHHLGKPVRLSERDYLDALEAGARTKAECIAAKAPRIHEPAFFAGGLPEDKVEALKRPWPKDPPPQAGAS